MAKKDTDKLHARRDSVADGPQGRVNSAIGSDMALEAGSFSRADQRGSVRRLGKMLLASLVVHLVITPMPAILGLAAIFPAMDLSASSSEPEPALTVIPIDFLGDNGDGADGPKTSPSVPPPEPLPSEPESSVEKPSTQEESSDGTLPEAEPRAQDLAEQAEGVEREQEVVEPPTGEEGAIGDPVALSGAAGKLADSEANVRLILYTDVVRGHFLGSRIGSLLKRTPQWSDFFGPAQVDPVRDIDRVLIAGPELRDSANVVAVVSHRLSEEKIDAAFEALAARGGRWVSRERRLITARADRAERIFAAPAAGLVAVAPLSAEKSVQALGKDTKFPKGPEAVALQAYVVDPSNAFRHLRFKVPKTIGWARAEVTPLESGGASVRLLAEDETAELAADNARFLERSLRAATEVDFSKGGALGAVASLVFGGQKQKFIEVIEFTSVEKRIEGHLELTKKQLMSLVDLLDTLLPPEAPEPRSAESTRQELPPPAPGPGEPSQKDGTVPEVSPTAPPSDEGSAQDGEPR